MAGAWVSLEGQAPEGEGVPVEGVLVAAGGVRARMGEDEGEVDRVQGRGGGQSEAVEGRLAQGEKVAAVQARGGNRGAVQAPGGKRAAVRGQGGEGEAVRVQEGEREAVQAQGERVAVVGRRPSSGVSVVLSIVIRTTRFFFFLPRSSCACCVCTHRRICGR